MRKLFLSICVLFLMSNSLFAGRYYDASIGRWLIPDPKDQYHSPYVYCGNNPLKYVDSDGYWADPVNNPQYRGWYGKTGNKWSPSQSKFGKVRGERYHQGVDLYAKPGTDVFACEGGEIVTVEKDHEDFGNQVILKFTVDKDGKKVTRYARYSHLKSINKDVKKGSKVKEGATIGTSGKTGNATPA